MPDQSASIPLVVNMSTGDPNEKVKEIGRIANFKQASLFSGAQPPQEFDHTSNNGIPAEGGISNPYLLESNALGGTYNYLTEDGHNIQIASAGTDGITGAPVNSISIDGKFIDTVPAHGLQYLTRIDASYDDIVFCDSGLLALKITTNIGGSSPKLAGTWYLIDPSNGNVISTSTFSFNNFGYSNPVSILRQPLGGGFGINSNLWIVCAISTNGAAKLLNTSNGNTSITIPPNIKPGVWACSAGIADPSWPLSTPVYLQIQGLAGYYSDPASGWHNHSYYWASFQSKGGFGRAILTGHANATSAVGMGGAITFTSSMTVAPTSNPSIPGTFFYATSSYCYSDIITSNAGPPHYFVSQGSVIGAGSGAATTSSMFTYPSSATNNPIKGCGRISWAAQTDYGSIIPFEFRLMLAPLYSSTTTSQSSTTGASPLGVQPIGISIASSACVSNGTDGIFSGTNGIPMGVPISNVGEIDTLFSPQISGDWSSCIWKYNGVFFVAKVSTTLSNPIQKISSKLYKINTISPINIVDSNSATLNLGSNDYLGNGAVFNAGTLGVGAFTASVYSKYANSIDYGLMISGVSTVVGMVFYPYAFYQSSSHSNVLGYYNLIGYGYNSSATSSLLASSVLNNSSATSYIPIVQSINNTNPTYIKNPVIPVPLGAVWSGKKTGINASAVSQAFKETYITSGYQFGGTTLSSDYDGYILGNVIPGSFSIFTLFSNTYLFDGENIYGLSLNSGAVTFPLPIVVGANGLTFLAASPTTAYFISNFDNSLYSFDGGQVVSKMRKFNLFSNVTNGAFNVRDNVLIMDSGTNWIFIRDGVISVNAKTANQLVTTARFYDTANGLYIGTDSRIWQYGYNPNSLSAPSGVTSTVTVQPITLQTAYYGMGNNEIMRGFSYYVTIYSSAKVATSIGATIYTFDQDELKGKIFQDPQSSTINITPSMYDDGGFFRFQVLPKNGKCLASSLYLNCSAKIAVIEIILRYQDEGIRAVYAPGRRAST